MEEAWRLLAEHISPEQAQEIALGYITVRGGPRRWYHKFLPPFQYRIELFDRARVLDGLGYHQCIRTTIAVPIADVILAKKLLIETNAKEFRRISGNPGRFAR